MTLSHEPGSSLGQKVGFFSQQTQSSEFLLEIYLQSTTACLRHWTEELKWFILLLNG